MVKAFPHAEVFGLDVNRVLSIDPPHNLHFEVEGINDGLAEFRGQFDVIRARSIGYGISDT